MTRLPAGLYETLITRELDGRLKLVEPELLRRGRLDPEDAHEALARHIAALTRQALRSVRYADKDAELAEKIALANRIAATIAELSPVAETPSEIVTGAGELLLAIGHRLPDGTAAPTPVRPEVPLGVSALLVNGKAQPSIGSELRKELASADRVDLICAFITWHGTIVLRDELREFVRRGGQLRVITTTYRGATQRRAVDLLVKLGAQVRISYDTRNTRMHAKAWLLRRATGFDTAFVGSSNLSKSAQTTGLEWNVRLSAVEQPHLIDTFEATFDEYWASSDFAEYLPERDGDLLDRQLAAERGQGDPVRLGTVSPLLVRPYGYQQEVLDELAAERQVHGRWRNLAVMATGTGKTVVAGLDYLRLRQAGTVETLLFVAHRQEILAQSMRTFQQIVRDGAYGEMLVRGQRPDRWQHVFASIQSLSGLDDLNPEHFDMVIVDEFHHAAASTYRRLLGRLSPKVLLGLTATPERADGQDILGFFDHRIAAELRLWEALERGLLAPFQYFGLADDTDLSSVRFSRSGGYGVDELDRLYTGDDAGASARVRLIHAAVLEHVLDPLAMRAVGFCVSVAHAEFMADRFRRAGIPAAAVTSATDEASRRAALSDLRERKVNVLFTVDLFNEGIDLPQIDTILLLRPTESATVFLQQLGRGLRLADGKPCLTVLDFIGVQHRDFRFDLRFRALTGASRSELPRQVEQGFPVLPGGCHITLDRVAARRVLDNVRRAMASSWRELVGELRQSRSSSLGEFLTGTQTEPEDLYRGGKGGWAALRRASGLDDRAPGPMDVLLGRAFGRMLHADDVERLSFWLDLLHGDGFSHPVTRRELRLARMLQTSLFGSQQPAAELAGALGVLWTHPDRREELLELARLLRERIHRVTIPLDGDVPLHVHARYDRFEVLRAFGAEEKMFNEGVKYVKRARADLFFVTLRKSERHFSPTTMYADHAITPQLFQWESQSTTSEGSQTARRYVEHAERGSTVHLFVRETGVADGKLGVPPYLYAGPMSYVEHSGSRPVRFVWRLDHTLPADVFHAAKVTTG